MVLARMVRRFVVFSISTPVAAARRRVAELRAAGYTESTIGQYKDTVSRQRIRTIHSTDHAQGDGPYPRC
jgi:hypothetical protein